MTQTGTATQMKIRFDTRKLASIWPTAAEIDKEIRNLQAQRSLRGESTDVSRDEAVAIILEVDHLGLQVAAANRAGYLRWRAGRRGMRAVRVAA